MRYIVQLTGTQVKYGDDADIFQFQLWENSSNTRTVEDSIVDLTGSIVTVDIANGSGFVGRFVTTTIPEKGIVNIDMSNEVIAKLPADTYYFQVEVVNGDKKKIFPTDGGDIIKIFKSLTETQGELVPRTTIDDVLNKVDEKIAEYTKTIAKGDKGDKGDMDLSQITVGGRNLLLNSQLLTIKTTPNAGATVVVVPYDSKTNMWHITAPQGGSINAGLYFPQSGNVTTPIAYGAKWVFSFDIKGVGVYSQNGIEWTKNYNGASGPVSSDWTRVSSTGSSQGDAKAATMYFNTSNSPLDVYIKLPKLEIGNVATDWTPAPEDINPNLAIGGRNLVLGTSEQIVQATDWNMKVADINYDKILGRTLYASVLISNADHASDLHQGSSYIVLEAFDKSGNILKAVNGNSVLYNANGISQCSINMDDNTASVRVRIRTNNMSLNTYYSRLKVERGSIPTDWTPAPEDVPSNDAQLVHKTGNETVAGDKSLTGNTTLATTTILAGNYGLRVTPSGFQKTTDGKTWVSANI